MNSNMNNNTENNANRTGQQPQEGREAMQNAAQAPRKDAAFAGDRAESQPARKGNSKQDLGDEEADEDLDVRLDDSSDDEDEASLDAADDSDDEEDASLDASEDDSDDEEVEAQGTEKADLGFNNRAADVKKSDTNART